jgi:histidine kinase
MATKMKWYPQFQMKWYRRLRWKLFISHLMVGVIAVAVVLATASVLANLSLVHDILGPYTASGSGEIAPDMLLEGQLLLRFEAVVQEALLAAAFSALLAAVIISLSVSLRIVEPLQAISAVSRRLAQGYYRERTVIESSDDELAELSRSVNQLAEALEQTEQRRLALIADVAHELRTPLSTISGYMEGLLDGVVQPEAQTFHLVLHESERLQRLIEDLMLLSRAEAGQIPIVPQVIDLRPILETQIARFQPQFTARQIALSLIVPDVALPRVWADPDRVDQVLINLLTNALRYTPDGGRVRLRAYERDNHMIIVVEDTGIGIAPEHLAHLFERFYRVDKSRARASGGSGIGLTIARHLVYAQHGDIWAESSGPGQGSRFIFTLPLEYMLQHDLAAAGEHAHARCYEPGDALGSVSGMTR